MYQTRRFPKSKRQSLRYGWELNYLMSTSMRPWIHKWIPEMLDQNLMVLKLWSQRDLEPYTLAFDRIHCETKGALSIYHLVSDARHLQGDLGCIIQGTGAFEKRELTCFSISMLKSVELRTFPCGVQFSDLRHCEVWPWTLT